MPQTFKQTTKTTLRPRLSPKQVEKLKQLQRIETIKNSHPRNAALERPMGELIDATFQFLKSMGLYGLGRSEVHPELAYHPEDQWQWDYAASTEDHPDLEEEKRDEWDLAVKLVKMQIEHRIDSSEIDAEALEQLLEMLDGFTDDEECDSASRKDKKEQAKGYIAGQYLTQEELPEELELVRRQLMQNTYPFGIGAANRWEYQSVLTKQMYELFSSSGKANQISEFSSGKMIADMVKRHGADATGGILQTLSTACQLTLEHYASHGGPRVIRGYVKAGGIAKATSCSRELADIVFTYYKELPTNPIEDVRGEYGSAKSKIPLDEQKVKGGMAEVDVTLDMESGNIGPVEIDGSLKRAIEDIQHCAADAELSFWRKQLENHNYMRKMQSVLPDDDLQQSYTFMSKKNAKKAGAEVKTDTFVAGLEVLRDCHEQQLSEALGNGKEIVEILEEQEQLTGKNAKLTHKTKQKPAGGIGDETSEAKHSWQVPAFELGLRTGLVSTAILLEQAEVKPKLVKGAVELQIAYLLSGDPADLSVLTTEKLMEHLGLDINVTTVRSTQRLLSSLKFRINGGYVRHIQSIMVANGARGRKTSSWNKKGYSKYNIMGFMKEIVEKSGIGTECPAQYILDKLYRNYRLGTVGIDEEGQPVYCVKDANGKTRYLGMPLRTVSKYRKELFEWGWV
ncbi:MAG: hypothetical protein ABW139_06685 [Candidatus Thiodiazotropha sp. DIVDIV]